mmetsp:Transcript_58778/g.156401  ORF Transcript_58778/g.156401 Transcript_58778/m.156401 type:complete len:210 (-) Transcript_58778:105-734(-)|eukprot:CAMPEP_0194543962 /NCGR_PEP_ID=MMETSP0253-20130528/86724_1 /TAXON_ID=2966 /ORGANISM="Noctiluca scintillans" /LENGTH=209 /DNA_ID=CAMNT_0039390781 /DNA_START=29 /DNA_END=655 /DNA_ORIENTATION=+
MANDENLDDPHGEDAQNTPTLAEASNGSLAHQRGVCKPCAFVHTRGCQLGASCLFCHDCPPGEKRRRIKERRAEKSQRIQRMSAEVAVGLGTQTVLQEAAPRRSPLVPSPAHDVSTGPFHWGTNIAEALQIDSERTGSDFFGNQSLFSTPGHERHFMSFLHRGNALPNGTQIGSENADADSLRDQPTPASLAANLCGPDDEVRISFWTC